MVNAIDGLQRLIDSIGHGDIVSKCIVDQVYAQRQHEELTWKHPHGGRAKYLEVPLFENSTKVVQIVAEHFLTQTGSNIQQGMVEVSEMMSQWVVDNAPRLEDELENSGHPQVFDNGIPIYDRTPKVPRIKN
jgi:hypothetical protein